MIGGLLLLTVSLVFAATPTPKTKDLKHLNQQIQQLQQEIQHDKGKKGKLAQQLKSNTAKLIKLQKQLSDLKAELNKQQLNLVNLQQEQTICQRGVVQQQSLLGKQVYIAYFLLNGTDSKNLDFNNRDRYLAYLRYCNMAQLTNLNQLQQKFKILNCKQCQVLSQKQEVQTVLSQQQKSQQQLAVAKQNQQQNLTLLTEQIQNKNSKLDQLEANKRALEQLIKKLSQMQQVAHPSSSLAKIFLPKGVPFTKLQGKLFWPISGAIESQYGASIGQSELKNTGVLIRSHLDQPVASIYQGKVVFANWLQGLGLLLIIDHGDGYMSLYGHNQTLYKKVGDMVKSRELVAVVNKGPEHSIGGLYFEIRHNGQPVNPGHWCRHQ